MKAYPLLFRPVYKDYIWGGQRIGALYGRAATGDTCAESWEISARPEGMSVVSNGPLRGKSLCEVLGDMGENLLGSGMPEHEFPLLIKIIDAKKDLSVQVHPANETAAATGGEPKTEMWYVLAAEEGARIYAGLRDGVTRDGFLSSLRRKKLGEEALASVPAVPGEAIFVPGGRVHAIGAGCLLLEVQQNSNTTYRVYDWDRTGKDGKPRPLHLNEALEVIDWDNSSPDVVQPGHRGGDKRSNHAGIINCPYFSTQQIDLSEAEEIFNDGGSFHALFVASGVAEVRTEGTTLLLPAGTSCLLPACIERYTMLPESSTARVIHIAVP